ncbi:hypothetical protein HID58_023375, partial [Brassica napus]
SLMNLLDLPEECIAAVISFTSPQDACRISAVSKLLRSAADSNSAWERFLPSDPRLLVVDWLIILCLGYPIHSSSSVSVNPPFSSMMAELTFGWRREAGRNVGCYLQGN